MQIKREKTYKRSKVWRKEYSYDNAQGSSGDAVMREFLYGR